MSVRPSHQLHEGRAESSSSAASSRPPGALAPDIPGHSLRLDEQNDGAVNGFTADLYMGAKDMYHVNGSNGRVHSPAELREDVRVMNMGPPVPNYASASSSQSICELLFLASSFIPPTHGFCR